MKIRVIGAVAAGTSAAAKARRNNPSADIKVYERGTYISYAGCGMPYYLAGDANSLDQLAPRNADYFKKKYNVEILTNHDVITLDRSNKQLVIHRSSDGATLTDDYDVLILATGAQAFRLDLPGATQHNVFYLRTLQDMLAMDSFIRQQQPRTCAIIGSGFIGLEMTETLVRRGLSVTVIEKLGYLDPALDEDMAPFIGHALDKHGVSWMAGAEVIGFDSDGVKIANGTVVPADLILVAVGIKPEVTLARQAGLAIGTTGAIAVNRQMRTSDSAIFACGDCCESFSVIDGKPLYVPLGSTANKTGRIAGDAATGGDLTFAGIAGTGIFRLFDLTVATTGYSERRARALGFEIIARQIAQKDRTSFLGGQDMTIKVIAEAETKKLLGAQIIGAQGVDKRIDVMATALTFGAKAADLSGLDLAYSPPFSTAREPIHTIGMVVEGADRH